MTNMSSFIGVACAAVAIATAMPAAAQVGETVTPHFEQAIPNIPGKSLVALLKNGQNIEKLASRRKAS
jgi:hypothetical protein